MHHNVPHMGTPPPKSNAAFEMCFNGMIYILNLLVMFSSCKWAKTP